MHMGIRIVTILFFICCTATVFAQKNLLVYHVNGTVVIQDGKNSVAAKRGATISKTNIVSLGPSSNVMIVDETGRSVQLDKKGLYNYSKVLQLLNTAKSDNVTSKFFAYVYQNLLYKKKEEGLKVAPVVYRDKPFMIFPTQYSIIHSDSVRFAWRKNHPKATSRFVLKTESGDIILDTVFRSETVYELQNKSVTLKHGQIYQWQITEEGNNANSSTFYFLVANQDDSSLRDDILAIKTSSFPKEVKQQLMLDLMLKWKEQYNKP